MDHKADDALSEEPGLRVRLMAPTNGALYVAPATIVLAATLATVRRHGRDASDHDDGAHDHDHEKIGDGCREQRATPHMLVVKVEFFDGERLIGTVSAAPYAHIWTNVTSGNHVLTAQAIHASGTAVRSERVSITVDTPPTMNRIAQTDPNCCV